MSVETATTISGLIPTNPLDSDPVSQGAAHIRLIKGALLGTFPAVAAVVTASDAQINATAGNFVAATGTQTLPNTSATSTGSSLILNAGSTGSPVALTNAAGVLGLGVVGGSGGATLDSSGNAVFRGSVTASSIVTTGAGAGGFVPSGGIIMWSGATAPVGWFLCDGTNGTPDLRGQFIVGADPGAVHGVAYPLGGTGGSNMISVTTAAAGDHSHGGATQVGTVTVAGTTSTVGNHSHGGETVPFTLAAGNLPPHTHGAAVTVANAGNVPSGQSLVLGGSTPLYNGLTTDGGNGLAAAPFAPGINGDGSHAHSATLAGDTQLGINTDGSHTHTVSADARPPFYVLAYIMKS